MIFWWRVHFTAQHVDATPGGSKVLARDQGAIVLNHLGDDGWMCRWKLGSMVRKWVTTLMYHIFKSWLKNPSTKCMLNSWDIQVGDRPILGGTAWRTRPPHLDPVDRITLSCKPWSSAIWNGNNSGLWDILTAMGHGY